MQHLLLITALFSFCSCVPNAHVGDSVEARNLFRKGDFDHDHLIRLKEFIQIFLAFDENNDGVVTTPEFVGQWSEFELGPSNEAIVLFYNIDVNKDGQLTENVDLNFVFNYFDLDHNHQITEAEFAVQWVKLSLA